MLFYVVQAGGSCFSHVRKGVSWSGIIGLFIFDVLFVACSSQRTANGARTVPQWQSVGEGRQIPDTHAMDFQDILIKDKTFCEQTQRPVKTSHAWSVRNQFNPAEVFQSGHARQMPARHPAQIISTTSVKMRQTDIMKFWARLPKPPVNPETYGYSVHSFFCFDKAPPRKIAPCKISAAADEDYDSDDDEPV